MIKLKQNSNKINILLTTPFTVKLSSYKYEILMEVLIDVEHLYGWTLKIYFMDKFSSLYRKIWISYKISTKNYAFLFYHDLFMTITTKWLEKRFYENNFEA